MKNFHPSHIAFAALVLFTGLLAVEWLRHGAVSGVDAAVCALLWALWFLFSKRKSGHRFEADRLILTGDREDIAIPYARVLSVREYKKDREIKNPLRLYARFDRSDIYDLRWREAGQERSVLLKKNDDFWTELAEKCPGKVKLIADEYLERKLGNQK